MWAEQRQETVLFQWKAVTPFLCTFFSECNWFHGQEGLWTAWQIRCYPGDLQLYEETSQHSCVKWHLWRLLTVLSNSACGSWAVGGIEAQPQHEIICQVKTRDKDILMLGHWAQLEDLWAAVESRRWRDHRALGTAQHCCFSLAAGMLRRSRSPMQH